LFHRLTWSPDGRLIVIPDRLELLVFDVAEREVSHRLLGHTGPINRVAFSRGGEILISTG